MADVQTLINQVKQGDTRSLARAITIVENELAGTEEILQLAHNPNPPQVLGITGPPGAGKSTLINSLISFYSSQNKRTAVVAIDPTSPFNYGSLLGDRIRMAEHFNDPNVFIRSLATRGSLGGLSAKTLEIIELIKSAPFDQIIVETVGVGQSEVEIAGLADTTVLVLVPEAGDEIQNIKSGIMEIADVFVVNKSDRPGAEGFVKNLEQLVHSQPAKGWIPKVVKTVASSNQGIEELSAVIATHRSEGLNEKKLHLLAEKCYRMIQSKRMKDIKKEALYEKLTEAVQSADFNLYTFCSRF